MTLTETQKNDQPQHMRGIACHYCGAPAQRHVSLIPVVHWDGGAMRIAAMRLGEPVCDVHSEPGTWSEPRVSDNPITQSVDALNRFRSDVSAFQRIEDTRSCLERLVHEAATEEWRCPMHPLIYTSEPGTCGYRCGTAAICRQPLERVLVVPFRSEGGDHA